MRVCGFELVSTMLRVVRVVCSGGEALASSSCCLLWESAKMPTVFLFREFCRASFLLLTAVCYVARSFVNTQRFPAFLGSASHVGKRALVR